MKGTPWLELAAVLSAVLLLIGPLVVLTRDAPPMAVDTAGASVSTTETLEAWIDFRFSHAPSSWRLLQGDSMLAQGDGDLRDDVDVMLTVRENRSDVVLEVIWPDEAQQAYVEAVVEAGEYPALTRGGWGERRARFRWDLKWERL